MNPDANPNASSDPRPGPGLPAPPARPLPPAAPSAGGLASVLKVALPLVILVGVVFGITYITMYAPKKEEVGPTTGPEGTSSDEPPLRFFTTTREWDPPRLAGGYRELPLLAPSAIKGPPDVEAGQVFNYTLQDRTFQGVFEASADAKRTTHFWFENRNPQGVTLELKGVGCSACTSGRVAAIPPEATRNLLQCTAVGALPVGPFGGLTLAVVPPAAGFAKLPWDEQSFENYRTSPVKFHVPGESNPDGWSPQWGILELQFKTASERRDPLTADFAVQADGKPDFMLSRFAITFHIATPCEASPATIDAGRIEATTGDRTYDVLVYSSTRGPGSEFGDLERPSYRVEGPPGADATPFVEVLDGKTVRVPEAELPDLHNQLRTRVRSAYRFTVAVHPKVGEKRMDIGKFERAVAFTAGGVTQPVRVTATVRGSVWLDNDRSEIVLPSFSGKRGLIKSAWDLNTEKPDAELALVKDEGKPAKFTYELEKQPARGGQGHYKLLVTVPPGQYGTQKDEVVLEVKGPNPQRMRIPVAGSGTFGQ